MDEDKEMKRKIAAGFETIFEVANMNVILKQPTLLSTQTTLIKESEDRVEKYMIKLEECENEKMKVFFNTRLKAAQKDLEQATSMK